MFIAALCGGAAWTAGNAGSLPAYSISQMTLTEVTIVRRVQPPSQPPPAGGRSRVPAPSGGGSARGPSPCPRSRGAGGTPALAGHVHQALCAPRMGPDVNMGEPGSPTPPPPGRWGRSPCAGAWGKLDPDGRVLPGSPGAARAQGRGESGFPPPPARGRVWAGAARAQGRGESGFPPPPARGRVWAGAARAQGCGESGFPPPLARGRVWAGAARAQGHGESGFPPPRSRGLFLAD